MFRRLSSLINVFDSREKNGARTTPSKLPSSTFCASVANDEGSAWLKRKTEILIPYCCNSLNAFFTPSACSSTILPIGAQGKE